MLTCGILSAEKRQQIAVRSKLFMNGLEKAIGNFFSKKLTLTVGCLSVS